MRSEKGKARTRREKKIDSQMNEKKLWMKNYINKLLIFPPAHSLASLAKAIHDSAFTAKLARL